MANGYVSGSDGLNVNDGVRTRGFERPGRPAKFTQEHTPDVVGVHDSRGTLDERSAFKGVETNTRGLGDLVNFGRVNACPWSVSPQMKSTGGNGHVGILHPMEPSISNSSNLLSSTAYSIGSSRVNGSKNPLTMRPIASSSENPRLMR